MADVAQTYQNQLDRIKKNIENAYEYFRPNYERYNKFSKFVFKSSLTNEEVVALQGIGKPTLEFNFLEAYVSRLRGEFSKQEPSISVRAVDGKPVDPKMIDTTEGHMRSILFDANNDSFEYEVYTDLLVGGFSGIKVFSDYENEMSFNQNLYIRRVYDPTLMFHDPEARLSHKGDGRFCGEVFPISIHDFTEEHSDVDISQIKFNQSLGGFNWAYQNGKEKIILVCDYYEKKKKKIKIVQLANQQVMSTKDYNEMVKNWTQIEQPPAIVGKPRDTEIVTICRYRVIQNKVLEYKETNYKFLPIIFVDGNSRLIRNTDNGDVQQFTRPYVYHAVGLQRLKNFAGQTLANELENMVQSKFMIAEEAIAANYVKDWINPQSASTLVYNAFKPNDNTNIPLPPPSAVPRAPIPPEVTNTFMASDQMVQAILGNYDAALGVNDNQLSGIAIIESATQSNAAAMPYVVGFLQGLNQAAQVILDLIPKYYVTPRTIPVISPDGKRTYHYINQQGGVNLAYTTNVLEVRVEAGVNFAIQKSRALQQIIGLMQASPLFAQFMNQEGLPILLDNLEILGADQLKEAAETFMQNMKQQQAQQAQMASQMNPIALKQQELAAKQQQNQAENALELAKLQNDNIEIQLQAMSDHQDRILSAAKIQAENLHNTAKFGLESKDQLHQHAKDAIELTHNIIQDHTQNTIQQQQIANQVQQETASQPSQ